MSLKNYHGSDFVETTPSSYDPDFEYGMHWGIGVGDGTESAPFVIPRLGKTTIVRLIFTGTEDTHLYVLVPTFFNLGDRVVILRNQYLGSGPVTPVFSLVSPDSNAVTGYVLGTTECDDSHWTLTLECIVGGDSSVWVGGAS